MRTLEFKSPLCLGLLSALTVVSFGFAQGTLIGPSTRNGSFEDGTLLPWFGNFSVAQDSSFATQGSWYALVQSSVVFSPDIGQNLTPDPNSGLLFLLTFDARIGNPGYPLLTTTMDGRSPGGRVAKRNCHTNRSPAIERFNLAILPGFVLLWRSYALGLAAATVILPQPRRSPARW